MGMLDFITGGKSSDAEDAMKRAVQAFSGTHVPTIGELTMPELQSYVEAGIMTPEEAQAFMQNKNAYADQNVSQVGNENALAALSDLSGVADAGPNGTPMEQAQVGQAIDQMNESVRGQRGAIEQAAEARGTPAALVQAALSNQSVGQDAQQAHRDALQAQAQAYQQAVAAMAERGTQGQAYQKSLYDQSNTVANASNAMQQFNARNQQQAAQFNASQRQAANAINTANKQDVSNQNTQVKNTRTAYNAQLPQTQFQDQMQRASGMSGAETNSAKLAQEQGKQEAGIFSGLVGTGSNLMGDYMMANGLAQMGGPAAMAAVAKGGILTNHEGCYHEGGICMDDGGMVPGEAKKPGDSLENDTVHVMASPGEAVIPRSSVQEHMPEVMALIAEARTPGKSDGHHPEDVASLLNAMKSLRMGVS